MTGSTSKKLTQSQSRESWTLNLLAKELAPNIQTDARITQSPNANLRKV